MAHPENWSHMTTVEKRENAKKLFNSPRGHLIIGQALARAILIMRTAEHPERSNIEDMECLGMLFEPWFTIHMKPIPPNLTKVKG